MHKQVVFKQPLRVVTTDAKGRRVERSLGSVTEAEADWQWVPPGCLQVMWWGTAVAKAEAQEALRGGGSATVDIYIVPASNVLQIVIPGAEVRGPSAVVAPPSSPIVRPH